MTEDQAKTIINEFNSGVDETQRIFYDADPTENISIAEGIINDAAEAFREGMRGEFVTTILSLSESFTSNNNTEDPYIIRRLAEAKIAKEKLPIPPEIDGTPPDLPRDISVLSDSQLRRFHSEFHALLARANWLVAVEESDEHAADQIARHYKAMVLRDLTAVADKNAKITALEAEAAGDPDVRQWNQKKNEHYVQVKLLKALRDTYEQTCDRMSREYTMRGSER
jgi:hypothetical protein